MNDGREAERAHLDGLMYRMLGGLLLVGAALLLILLVLLLRLPRETLPDGAVLRLPGTGGRHGLSPLVLPILGAGAILLGLPGLAALALARRHVRFAIGLPRAAGSRPWLRPVLVFLAGAAVLAAVLLRRKFG